MVVIKLQDIKSFAFWSMVNIVHRTRQLRIQFCTPFGSQFILSGCSIVSPFQIYAINLTYVYVVQLNFFGKYAFKWMALDGSQKGSISDSNGFQIRSKLSERLKMMSIIQNVSKDHCFIVCPSPLECVKFYSFVRMRHIRNCIHNFKVRTYCTIFVILLGCLHSYSFDDN